MPNGTSNVGDSTVDWNDVAHLLADEVAAKIPVVGWAVQLILDKFWPSDTSSVWDSISDQVQHLVEQSQIAQKINNNSEYIKTLEGTLREYLQEQPPGRGRRLDEAKMQAETLRDQITDLNDIGAQHIHFLPLAVLVSHLHLTILAERNKHGAAVSGIAYDPAWAEELTAARRYYEDYFKQAFKDWWGWRIAQIEQHNGRTYEPAVTPRWDAHGSAKDNLIPYQIYYSDTNNSNSDYYYDVSCAAYRMLVNRARADMAQALSSTFMLHLYDPTTAADPPHLNPDIAFLELGPYCPATLGENGTGSVRIASTDTAGTVIAATIQAGNSVDGLQLHYGGHDGNFSGPGSASGPGRVEVPEHAYCTGFQAHFNDRLMYDIALQYSDGSSTPSYGNAGRWTGKLADATVGSAYALVRAGFAGGSGPSGTSGTEVVLLTYAHSSLINTNGPPGWIERGPIRIKGSGSIPLAGGAPALASNTMGSYAVYKSSSGDKTLWFSTVNANGEWSYNAQIVTEDGGTPLTGGAPAMASLRETVYLVYPSSKAGDKSLWFAWGGAAAWFGNRQISIGAGPLANSAPALAKLGNYLFLVYEILRKRQIHVVEPVRRPELVGRPADRHPGWPHPAHRRLAGTVRDGGKAVPHLRSRGWGRIDVLMLVRRNGVARPRSDRHAHRWSAANRRRDLGRQQWRDVVPRLFIERQFDIVDQLVRRHLLARQRADEGRTGEAARGCRETGPCNVRGLLWVAIPDIHLAHR